VVLLVEIAQCDRVGQNLIEVLDALARSALEERNRQAGHMAKGLDLTGFLVIDRSSPVERRWRTLGPAHGVNTSSSVQHVIATRRSPGRLACITR
jgi:hypothetical protein